MRFGFSLLLLGCAACGSPTLDAKSALAVVDLSPTDGAVDVPLASSQSACFSAAVLADDASDALFWVADASGDHAPGLQVSPSPTDAHCVTLSHEALAAGSGYVLHVEPGVRAADGSGSLPVAVDSHFTTVASP